jgi:simple sugar transport system ATP-binding protein
MDSKPLVSVRGVGKSFGPTRALHDVSFDFHPGEIFAMVGANGAGKSTLIKIICGYYAPDQGEIFIDGEPVRFSTPQEAYQKGIQTVHQIINQGVVQNMTVAENLALADLLAADGGFFHRPKAVKLRAAEIAAKMDLGYLDLDAPVEDLAQSDRQMIAIARALASNPKLLILDEPTSSLSDKEAERLFTTLFKLRDMGVSILYVSHRLHEIERIADRVGVIRDGVRGGILAKPFKVKEIVTAMVGELEGRAAGRQGTAVSRSTPRLELVNLEVEPGSPRLNLSVYPGEILGITGLIGAGKSELAKVLFGVNRAHAGQVRVNGVPVAHGSVRDAVKAGIFMVPEDRSNTAVIPDFSIRKNITLPFLDRFSSLGGLLNHGSERREAERMVRAMGVKCHSESSDIAELSGGNQQKVIVARWLSQDFNVLILDEPYQGVDIKSRHDINRYLTENRGERSIIVMAADLDEVLEVADRVVVFNNGAIAGEQPYEALDRARLLHWTTQSPEDQRVERSS